MAEKQEKLTAEQHKVEYAIMPLEDNGHAFGFLPSRDE